MAIYQPGTESPLKNADILLEEFIAELDEMSSNGVVKHPDMARISDLREHFIGQCTTRQQAWLAAQIDLILSSKIHYFDEERKLNLTDLTESKILDTIRIIVRSLKDRAPKYIGLVLSMRWINPVHWAKSFLQPAVANSILTFSVVMNPPAIETERQNTDSGIPNRRSLPVTAVPSSPKTYDELLSVKPYTQEALQVSIPDQKKTITSRRFAEHSGEKVELLPEINSGSGLNKVVYGGEITKISVDASASEKLPRNALNGAIRPQSEIQNVFYLNDHRLRNCFPANSRHVVQKKEKVSLKFVILPTGKPKKIEITEKTISQSVADRLILQIYQLRFSPVDQKSGDQTVFHTLYF